MYDKFGLSIDGRWHKGASSAPVFNPASATPLGDCPQASVADTVMALEAAAQDLKPWAATPAFPRADAPHLIADEMTGRTDESARMISTETGKPIAQAGREWGLSVDPFRWGAEEARRSQGRIVESRVPVGRFESHHQPVGVVAAFTARNFPAALLARKIVPALAAGCSVIARPSSQTPGVAMVMVDCCRVGALPDGTVNLVVGPTEASYQPIMADKRVRKVSLTGSTRVGQRMIRDAAATLKEVSMELGGTAPLIICDDADPDLSVAIFPPINARPLTEIETTLADAIRAGAKLAHGGTRAAGFNAGHFFDPTVLTQCSDEMKVMAAENLGPIAAITRFSTEDEVLACANASDMGLSAYAFTNDPARARRTVSALKAGMVGINSYALAGAEAPFGGTGHYGMGREGGIEGIRDYLDIKSSQVVWA